MKECPNCHREIEDDLAFCGYCGTPLSVDMPKYLPGFEPENIKKSLALLFSKIDKVFPDKKIIWSEWDHERWDKAANTLCRALEYKSGRAFLETYGYMVVQRREDLPQSFPNPEFQSIHQHDFNDTSISNSNQPGPIPLSSNEMHNTKRKKGSSTCFNIRIPIIIIASIVLFISARTLYEYFSYATLIIVIISGIILLGVIVIELDAPKCPNCNKKVSSMINKKYMYSESINIKKRVQDRVYRTDRFGSTKELEKLIEREVVVPGIREYYSAEYMCRNCGNVYSRKEYSDHEQ